MASRDRREEEEERKRRVFFPTGRVLVFWSKGSISKLCNLNLRDPF